MKRGDVYASSYALPIALRASSKGDPPTPLYTQQRVHDVCHHQADLLSFKRAKVKALPLPHFPMKKKQICVLQ